MTYKRLTPDEKAAILAAVGQGEGIKELATKFGVSENTIRRTIKAVAAEPPAVVASATPEPTPPPKSAPQLVKRAISTPSELELPPEPEHILSPGLELLSPASRKPLTRRKRSSRQPDVPPEPASESPLPPLDVAPSKAPAPAPPIAPLASLGLDLAESPDLAVDDDEEDEDDLTGLAGADLDDFSDDDFDEEEDDTEGVSDSEEVAQMLAEEPSPAEIAIFPLDAAVLPRPCYLVIDTRSELLARPLAEFQGLGHAAQEEEQQKTLPIFESRAVALRFSQRNQRIYKNSESILRKTVIKVPDGDVLRKTSSYLQGKGITRLLIHGQVYALE